MAFLVVAGADHGGQGHHHRGEHTQKDVERGFVVAATLGLLRLPVAAAGVILLIIHKLGVFGGYGY